MGMNVELEHGKVNSDTNITDDDDIMINLYMVTVEYDKKWTLIYRWFFTRHVEPSDFYKTYLTPEP